MISWLQKKYQFKSLLCLNHKGYLARDILHHYRDLPLIATDGAANQLLKNEFIPDIIIGDLDSLVRAPHIESSQVIKISVQDTTDFEKALLYIKEHTLFPTLILGLSGGEADHTLNNMHSFMRYSKTMPLVFNAAYDAKGQQYGFPLLEDFSFECEPGAKVSIIPFPQVTVSSSGLKWELAKHSLNLTESTSARNESTSSRVHLTLHQGAALLFISG